MHSPFHWHAGQLPCPCRSHRAHVESALCRAYLRLPGTDCARLYSVAHRSMRRSEEQQARRPSGNPVRPEEKLKEGQLRKRGYNSASSGELQSGNVLISMTSEDHKSCRTNFTAPPPRIGEANAKRPS